MTKENNRKATMLPFEVIAAATQGDIDALCKQIAVSPDEYIIVRGTHEPIVSREMFEKAKQFRESVREEYKQKTIDHYTETLIVQNLTEIRAALIWLSNT